MDDKFKNTETKFTGTMFNVVHFHVTGIECASSMALITKLDSFICCHQSTNVLPLCLLLLPSGSSKSHQF